MTGRRMYLRALPFRSIGPGADWLAARAVRSSSAATFWWHGGVGRRGSRVAVWLKHQIYHKTATKKTAGSWFFIYSHALSLLHFVCWARRQSPTVIIFTEPIICRHPLSLRLSAPFRLAADPRTGSDRYTQ